MFWIAQPKAASSSLGTTIAKILKVKYINGLVTKPKIFCNEFSEIQRWHNTMIPRTKKFMIDMYNDKSIFYKEHILPTTRHLNIIRNFNKPLMILLRRPNESYDAYIRFNNKEVLKRYGKKLVNLKKIKKDIELFYWRYKALEVEKLNHLLFITYRDLMFDFTETLKKIFEHYGWKLPENYDKIELQKIKYTGVGIKRIKNEGNNQ